MIRKIRNAIRLADAHARRGELSLWRQLAEMVVLWLWRRQGPSYYQLARFWRKDMPWRDKLDHLTEPEYRKAVDRLNPERYRKISQHKVVEKAVLTLLGFRTPAFLGYFHRTKGRTAAGKPLRNAAELEALLTASSEERVCFKLVEGWGGSQFMAVRLLRENGMPRLHDFESGAVTTIQEWTNRLTLPEGYLIESYLEQHPRLAELNPTSLNTLRIWIVLTEQGGHIPGAFLRVGHAGSIVDNTSRGGLICPIDLETGVMRYADEAGADRITHESHPDTHVPVSGVAIPHWEECKALAHEALRAFPHMHFAGLDIAVGTDGPWIIELNMQPDRRAAADFDVPTARALKMN
jgi:hypothetical protein